jgi:hypothetical protein
MKNIIEEMIPTHMKYMMWSAEKEQGLYHSDFLFAEKASRSKYEHYSITAELEKSNDLQAIC